MESVLIGGRFRLHRLLGSGAMGQVWLATDERLQRPVAVKVVIPDADDAQLGKRLEREARAAAAIQHTNVVRVFDYIEVAEGQTLIVMEYVEGETLADRVATSGPVPLEDALDIMSQICDGLAAAHRVNLVHRDLKPSNVMVTPDGVAKVLDFGIAKQTGRKESALTMTGAVIGTPRYMAPEQLTGEALSPQADLHAAGLLMYEMLAGKPAFDRENIAELMYQLLHAGADMRPLEERGVPAEVMAILEKALQKRPENRWQNARAMADALKVSLYGDVIRARNTPSSAGLRAIIDSGERTLTRAATGEGTAPVTATSSSGEKVMPPVTLATPQVPTSGASSTAGPIVERRAARDAEPAARPKSSNVPLIVVPAVVLALVGAFVFYRTRGGESSATPVPPATVAAVDTTAKDSAASAKKPETTATPAAVESVAPPAVPAAETVDPAVKASADSARASDARSNEIVRRALASEVESQWRAYLKLVVPVLGDEISDLRADFSVLVNQAGQLADVRPGAMSEEAVFNDNASKALQSIDGIRVGSARRPNGWPMRVRFVGTTVRVSLR